jgi:hypothetical protein
MLAGLAPTEGSGLPIGQHLSDPPCRLDGDLLRHISDEELEMAFTGQTANEYARVQFLSRSGTSAK